MLEFPETLTTAGKLSWRAMDGEADYTARRALYVDAGVGPDGYEMSDGRYSEYEKRKEAAGYMLSFALYEDSGMVGCVSLSVNCGFGRLKNLMVHPARRSNGYGRLMVRALMCEASARGARSFGAYASEGKAGHNTYLSSGMKEVTRQVEYQKQLSSVADSTELH